MKLDTFDDADAYAGSKIIIHSVTDTLAHCKVAILEGRLIDVSFHLEQGICTKRKSLSDFWPGFEIQKGDSFSSLDDISKYADGLLVKGTTFQLQVWDALLEIPKGKTWSYGDVARFIGNPRASQAVGQAVGANRLAYFIPCHRVLAASGAMGGFAWGVQLKKRMLDLEGVSFMIV